VSSLMDFLTRVLNSSTIARNFEKDSSLTERLSRRSKPDASSVRASD
jgi:hypothetical protein